MAGEFKRAWRSRLGFDWIERRAGHSRWWIAWANPWKVLEYGTEGLGV